MEDSYEGYADIDGERISVTCYYELDGYKSLGLYICNLDDADITDSVPESEYDRLYNEAMQDAVSAMTDAADYLAER